MTESTKNKKRGNLSQNDCSNNRFSAAEKQAFESSGEYKRIVLAMFTFAVFFIWPYQTVSQSQSWIQSKFPGEVSINFLTMVFSTLPYSICMIINLLLGNPLNSVSYKIRIIAGNSLYLFSGIFFVVCLSVSNSYDANSSDYKVIALIGLYGTALLISFAECLCQASVFQLAGLFPSKDTMMAIMSGTGACGVIVSVVQISARLIFVGVGTITESQEEALTYGFFAVMMCTAITSILLFVQYVSKTESFKAYVDEKGNNKHFVEEHLVQKKEADSKDSEPSNFRKEYDTVHPHSVTFEDFDGFESDTEASDAFSSVENVRLNSFDVDSYENLSPTSKLTRMQSVRIALTYSWKPMLGVWFVYWVTLTLWPVIPGSMCVSYPGSENLQTWWFDIIIIVYNVGDFIGKSEKNSLNWASKTFSKETTMYLSIMRAAVFFPLLITAAAPQLYSAEIGVYVVSIGTLFLGITNGWLHTLAFMNAPQNIPANLPGCVAENVGNCCVLALYCGISSGALTSYFLGTYALEDVIGVCFNA